MDVSVHRIVGIKVLIKNDLGEHGFSKALEITDSSGNRSMIKLFADNRKNLVIQDDINQYT